MLSHTDTGPVPHNDYVANPAYNFTFPAGENVSFPMLVTVNITDDEAVEPEQRFVLDIAVASDVTINLETTVLTLRITDNDGKLLVINFTLFITKPIIFWFLVLLIVCMCFTLRKPHMYIVLYQHVKVWSLRL